MASVYIIFHGKYDVEVLESFVICRNDEEKKFTIVGNLNPNTSYKLSFETVSAVYDYVNLCVVRFIRNHIVTLDKIDLKLVLKSDNNNVVETTRSLKSGGEEILAQIKQYLNMLDKFVSYSRQSVSL